MKKTQTWDVVVVGGGPAGMMVAGQASSRGRSVILLEKNEKLGKKLLITGGGRCNVTNNTPDVRTILAKYKGAGKFLFSAFSQFSVNDTITFFESRGMALKEENERRMFPVSDTARSVYDTLVKYMKEGGVVVQTKSSVVSIDTDRNRKCFKVILRSGEEIYGRSCVVAVGGTSRPETGSTGDAFLWLKKFGHTVVQNNFALVPLSLKDSWAKKLGGVTLTDVKLTVFADNKKTSVHKGKLLFTHFGVSGPTVLNMSAEIGELLSHSEVRIDLDLFPSLDAGELRKKLQGALIEESNKKIKNVLSSLIPSALVSAVLVLSGIDGETPSHSVRKEERTKLLVLLKAIPLFPSGLLGADKAIVSAGGVLLEEVDLKTMESRLVPNLYLVGDVLNIDRPSGGYSLQLCWTTGYVAGTNI